MLTEEKIRKVYRAAMKDEVVLNKLIKNPDGLLGEYDLNESDIKDIKKFFASSASRETKIIFARNTQEEFISEGKSWAT